MKKRFHKFQKFKKICKSKQNLFNKHSKKYGLTFLPLVIGVINIQIASLTKIEDMYRNPIHFIIVIIG